MKKKLLRLMKKILPLQKKNSKEYLMTSLSLKIGNYGCIKTTGRLLDSAETIMNNSTNFDHALGVYTLACEEFGKAVIMKESFIDNDNVIQKVPKDIFGFGKNSHRKKLQKAIENLPEKCTKILVGESVTIPSGKKMRMKLGIGDSEIQIIKGTTGIFLTDVLLNPKMRERCFYVDWDEQSNNWHKWKMNLKTDRQSLEEAINAMRQELQKFQIIKT